MATVKIAKIADDCMSATGNISAKSRVLIVKLVAVALYHRHGGKLKSRKPEMRGFEQPDATYGIPGWLIEAGGWNPTLDDTGAVSLA